PSDLRPAPEREGRSGVGGPPRGARRVTGASQQVRVEGSDSGGREPPKPGDSALIRGTQTARTALPCCGVRTNGRECATPAGQARFGVTPALYQAADDDRGARGGAAGAERRRADR